VFVDHVNLFVKAGDGGRGCVSFRHEKYVPKGGPSGGNGGKGGDVIVRANPQLRTLLDHRYKRKYIADDGGAGSTSNKSGRWGEDCIIEVPCGTIIRDPGTNEVLADLVVPGQEYLAARGGKGGRGNAEFATAVQRTPRFAEDGVPGENHTLSLELKLIADIGLVGLPNVGKSTLLSVISAAKPKIADYPFTTLEPNLGIVRYHSYKSFTVADIPGLIEGAHLGKGLGTQFLRHIERTKVIVILIDVLSADYQKDLDTLRSELSSYGIGLKKKPYFIAISKHDIADDEAEDRIKKFRSAQSVDLLTFSSISGESLSVLLDKMWKTLEEYSSPDGVEEEITLAE
jgi:GTPase